MSKLATTRILKAKGEHYRRQCRRCGVVKGISQFPLRPTDAEPFKHSRLCFDCPPRRSSILGRSPDLLAEKLAKQALVREHKSRPCADCGGIFHFSAMDFDHVRGKKKFQLSKARKESYEAIEDELAKCDVVCANCHRLRTFKRHHPHA